MSLLDMINFVLDHFISALRLLEQEITVANERAAVMPDALLVREDFDRLNGIFRYVYQHCVRMELSNARNRAERINDALQRRLDQLTYSALANQLQVLKEAIEDDVRFERFFHYQQERVQPYMKMRGEWAATLSAFPSAEPEIEEGLDCYGLEHSTACVFHMMRVAEHGLRALARERQVSFPNKPIEWANWQDLIDKIESSGRTAARALSGGPKRDSALSFYTGASGQFHAFKDKYRNAVMHSRVRYDELDALRVINQVRDFMNGLSSKIGEKTRRPVGRWP